MSGNDYLSSYIVTRWYRAPELLLGNQRYDSSIDMWAAGCVIFEMSTSNILFEGQSTDNQLKQLVSIMGNPQDLNFIQNEAGRAKLQQFPAYQRRNWIDVAENRKGARGPSWMSNSCGVNHQLHAVLDRLLQWTQPIQM